MKWPTISLATLAFALALVAGSQSMYITKIHRQSAAWQQRVAADSVQRQAFLGALAVAGGVIASYDSTVRDLRADRRVYRAIADSARGAAEQAKAEARNPARSDSTRLAAYEVAIRGLEDVVVAKTAIIESQARELDHAAAVRHQLEAVVQRSFERIAELEALVAAAPAVQAPAKGPGPFKVVVGFLAGAVTGLAAGLVLR
jgi:hypothetical protein